MSRPRRARFQFPVGPSPLAIARKKQRGAGGQSQPGAPLAHLDGFDFLVEVGYKPGVTDNVGRSSRDGMSDLLGRPLAKLTAEDLGFIDALLSETLVRDTVIARVRDRFSGERTS